MADRINAQQVHEQFLIVLEKLSTLKSSKAFHQAVTDFVIKTESNIERTNSGDSKALDEARNSIRWMEALYPFRPEQCKDENISFGDEQLTEEHARPSGALQPPTGWQRYRAADTT